MKWQQSSPISTYSAIALLFMAFAQASDNGGVAWLYPLPPSSPQRLTYNTLDVLNVSWVSSSKPTYLHLACHNSTTATHITIPKTQVPSTGNRLISLFPIAPDQECCFELSSSTKDVSDVLSQSTSFNITKQEDLDPRLWTHSSPADSSTLGKPCESNKYKMVGVGVGVAVGVFVVTTAVYLLVVWKGRKERKVVAAAGEKGDKEARIEGWVEATRTMSCASCGERRRSGSVDTHGGEAHRKEEAEEASRGTIERQR